MEEILEKIAQTNIYDTKLENQILFMETLSSFIKTPITLSTLSSLKELRGIKINQVEKIKK